jgi:hypothetical protein
MGRDTSARQDQAHPLGWKDIKEFIESAGEGLRAHRERALLRAAYETLAIYRRLVGRDQIGGPLNPGSIAPIFKRVAQWIGMPARSVARVSGTQRE